MPRQIDRNPAGLLYGALVAGSVIAVSSDANDSAARVVGAVVEVLLVYWAAHVYTRALADRLAEPSSTLGHRVRESLGHEIAVLAGGLPALGAYVLAVVLGADAGAASAAALMTTVVVLGWVGYVVGRRAHTSGWALVGETAVACGLGVLVVGLKAGLQH